MRPARSTDCLERAILLASTPGMRISASLNGLGKERRLSNVRPGLLDKFQKDHASFGLLSTLKPVDRRQVESVRIKFAGISQSYLDFIETIGTGETKDGLFIYPPYFADELASHASFRLYNAPPSRRLFGLLAPPPAIPPKLVCVADSGASWRYCLYLDGSDKVVCLDMVGADVMPESDDFLSFVEQNVFSSAER